MRSDLQEVRFFQHRVRLWFWGRWHGADLRRVLEVGCLIGGEEGIDFVCCLLYVELSSLVRGALGNEIKERNLFLSMLIYLEMSQL